MIVTARCCSHFHFPDRVINNFIDCGENLKQQSSKIGSEVMRGRVTIVDVGHTQKFLYLTKNLFHHPPIFLNSTTSDDAMSSSLLTVHLLSLNEWMIHTSLPRKKNSIKLYYYGVTSRIHENISPSHFCVHTKKNIILSQIDRAHIIYRHRQSSYGCKSVAFRILSGRSEYNNLKNINIH